MKRLVKLSFVLLAMLGMLFTSCKKEYEKPPIDPFPECDSITIGDILAMSTNTSFSSASICGIVTADEQSGNLYKQIFIQDPATGKAIELVLNTSSAARIGDMVKVYLDSTIMYNLYHNLPQLVNSRDGKGFNPDKHLYIYPHQDGVEPIEPQTVTIADIKTGNYTAALVRLENVEFADQNNTFCDLGSTTNRTLKDATGEIIVRTSNYANFAYDPLPVGAGSLVAIASVYNSDWQLILRSTHNKEDFDFEGGTPPAPPAPAGEVQHMPYSQSFATDFGTYNTFDALGAQSWEIDYSTAKMTGYVNSTYYANEDWLISSPVEITGVTDAKMTVVYIARYFNKINEEITVWASTNFEYGTDPTADGVNWSQVSANFKEGSNWNDFLTTEIALTDYVGQTVTFAVKYTSTDSKAGTMEVQSITIQEGQAGGDTPTPPTPGPGGGSGTADDPYNVASGIALQSDEPIAWVQGYIVGAVKSGNTSVSANDQVNWAAPFDLATNVVIADDPTCHEITQCIIVNLPAGKPLRTQVNLMDNPGNLGKLLSVNGKLRRYFGQAGLRDSGGTENDFVLEGGDNPTPPPTPPQGIFSETFANGQGDFTIQDVVLPSELTYVWKHDATNHYMKGSAYKGAPYEAESWLISPVIDMSSVTTALLKFDQNVNYSSGAQPSTLLHVMVSTDYSGNVQTAQWTELTLSAWPTGTDWNTVSSTADMTSFAGQQYVTIAFKYTSQAVQNYCPTWEVMNVVVE